MNAVYYRVSLFRRLWIATLAATCLAGLASVPAAADPSGSSSGSGNTGSASGSGDSGSSSLSGDSGSATGSAGMTSEYLRDDQGRALILHGLNTSGSAKDEAGLPWISDADVVREHQQLGTNSVRYLLQWRKIEPQPGIYDEQYLDAVAERLRWYRSQDMHVILDMHQDTYSPYACGAGAGNGAPQWATLTDGLPCTTQNPWVLTYLQPAVVRAYDNFWNKNGNHPELMTRYTAMWQHVAQRFRDEPAVYGYDLMNEPFGGSRQFAEFEGPVLTPFYQGLIDAIRAVDVHGWIFAEPQSFGVNQGLGSDLGALRGDRIALAPHFYPGAVDLGGSNTGIVGFLIKAEFAAWRANMTGLARKLGRPLWIGEVGAMNFGVPGARQYTSDWLDLADSLHIGWTYWSNDPDAGCADNAVGPMCLNTGLTAVGRILAARPYPRAVAGDPTQISYRDGRLTVSWKDRAGVVGPTEIWFPGTGTPPITSSDQCRWDAASRTLFVTGAAIDGTHTVTVG
ncbi:cellulase family glycosylhydrolase [Nocardia tengchongensis]